MYSNDPYKLEGEQLTAGVSGPMATPGDYDIELILTKGNKTTSLKTNVTLVKDPRVSASDKDLDDQYNLLQNINSKLSEIHTSVEVIRINQEEIRGWISRSENASNHEKIKNDGEKLISELNAIEQSLVFSDYRGARDRLNFPVVLNAKLAGLIPVIDSADFKPTDQSIGVFNEIGDEVDQQFDKLKAMQESGLADFEDMVDKSNIPGLKSI